MWIRNRVVHKRKRGAEGFTLIAGLLLLALLSAIAVGLMYTVTGAGHAGNNDLESNVAFYGAESGMEKLTSDVLSLYQQKLAPTQADLANLATTSPPSNAQVPGVTFLESASWSNVDGAGNPVTGTHVVSQGVYAGLTAEIIPMTLQVSAIRPSGAAVNITRGIEIAMIPVFQFGVFSDSDLSYFAGPPFGFLGRVHTNGNLYLNSNTGPLVLGDKVTVVGQIMRDRLANDLAASGPSTYYGDVYLPNTSGGCDVFAVTVLTNSGAAAPSTCVNFGKDTDRTTDDSSWSGGIPASASPGLANSTWSTTSKSRFNSFAVTGVPTLTMPFVQGTGAGSADSQIEIIRKQETVAEAATSPIGSSREFNKANIRILLGDTQAELHPNGSGTDGNDVQLENLTAGVTVTGVGGKSYFAVGDPTATQDPNLVAPRCAPNGNAAAPYPTAAASENGCAAYTAATWPLVRGWLRVEYLDKTSGTWIGITNEWLGYGFSKSGLIPRTTPGADVSGHPNALLIFQQLADRNGDGTITGGGVDTKVYAGSTYEGYENSSISGSGTNFYPINFFDAREGFPRDVNTFGAASTQCYVNGIINAVELDVGNLSKWLAGAAPFNGGSGTKVNSGPQNGVLIYFSDRRGMEPDPNGKVAGVTNGESGLEDTINSADPNGMPDGIPETATAGYNNNNGFSPEDVDENNKLDSWGGANVGDGFGLNTDTNPASPNPYAAVDCLNRGRQSWVSGARHALRLIDGSLGNLPMPGFTVASENPVYVWGDYNSKSSDSVWQNPPVDTNQSAAAAIIADSVTLLSNDWTDLNDLKNVNNLAGRKPVNNVSYRVAIAAGKNMNFPKLTAANDFGTDGGVHNFLRYLESVGGITVNYRGSLISMYYSEYNTGLFKCCTMVYGAPHRNYSFDKDFLVPTKLPPGTPMLQDIDTLSYWQSFSPCTTQSGTTGNCTN